MTSLRRKIPVMFALTAVAMIPASIAYACITFKGTLTVTNNSGRTSGNKVVADPRASHSYCTAPTTAAQVRNGDSLTVTVGATGTTSCSTNTQLSTSTQKVWIYSNTTTYPFTQSGGVWSLTNGSGCFANYPTIQGTVQNGGTGFNPDASGNGSLTFTVSGFTGHGVDPAGDAQELCVGNAATGTEGIFAPVQFV